MDSNDSVTTTSSSTSSSKKLPSAGLRFAQKHQSKMGDMPLGADHMGNSRISIVTPAGDIVKTSTTTEGGGGEGEQQIKIRSNPTLIVKNGEKLYQKSSISARSSKSTKSSKSSSSPGRKRNDKSRPTSSSSTKKKSARPDEDDDDYDEDNYDDNDDDDDNYDDSDDFEKSGVSKKSHLSKSSNNYDDDNYDDEDEDNYEDDEDNYEDNNNNNNNNDDNNDDNNRPKSAHSHHSSAIGLQTSQTLPSLSPKRQAHINEIAKPKYVHQVFVKAPVVLKPAREIHTSPYLIQSTKDKEFNAKIKVWNKINLEGYDPEYIKNAQVIDNIDWTGPYQWEKGTCPLDYQAPTIFSQEFHDRRQLRAFRTRADYIMSILPRVIGQKEFKYALQLLVKARTYYIAARLPERAIDIDANIMKVKGQQKLKKVADNRKLRNYETCDKIVKQAFHDLKVAASLTRIRRPQEKRELERREKDKQFFKTFTDSKSYVQGLADQDAKFSKEKAKSHLKKRQFQEALEFQNDSLKAFTYAEDTNELRSINNLKNSIIQGENATRADQLVVQVSRHLHPITRKDFKKCFQQLDEAEQLFRKADDTNSVQLAKSFKDSIPILKMMDSSFIALARALKGCEYDAAIFYIKTCQTCLKSMSEGIPLVNSKIDRIMNLMIDQESTYTNITFCGLTPKECICEIALMDGYIFVEKSLEGMKRGNLSEAEIYLNQSKKCFEWIFTAIDKKYKNTDDNTKKIYEDTINRDPLEFDDICIEHGHQLLSRFAFIRKNFAEAGKKRTPAQVQVHTARQEMLQTRQNIDKQYALHKGNQIMERIRSAFKEQPLTEQETLDLLDKAHHIYKTWNFEEEADAVYCMKACIQGDRCIEEVQKMVETSKYTDAIGLLEKAKIYYSVEKDDERMEHIERLYACIRGDQLVQTVETLLDKRLYDEAVEVLDKSKKLYIKAKRNDRAKSLNEPKKLIEPTAVRDAITAEKESLSRLFSGNIEDAHNYSLLAKECYHWANKIELHNPVVDEAIEIAELNNQGIDIEKEAHLAILVNNRDEALEMLVTAQAIINKAQKILANVLNRASNCLQDEVGVAREGLDLQDIANKIQMTCIDTNAAARLSSEHTNLLMDKSMDKIEKLLECNLLEDIRLYLLSAIEVYKSSEDSSRVEKVTTLMKFFKSITQFLHHIDERNFDSSKSSLDEALDIQKDLKEMLPKTIRVPTMKDFQGNDSTEVILLKAKSVGTKDRNQAQKLLDAKEFEEAQIMLDKACISFEYVANKTSHGNWKKEEGIEELQQKISNEYSRNKATQLLKEANEIIESLDYDLALSKMQEAMYSFKDSGDSNKASDVQLLIYQTNGDKSMVVAKDLYKNNDFSSCLAELKNTASYYNSAGNHEKEEACSKFAFKVEGDKILQTYEDACEKGDYDLALRIRKEAVACYKKSGDRTITLIRENSFEKVKAKANKMGDTYKADAIFSLTRNKDSENAKYLIQKASVCYEWAGINGVQSGVKAVEKDIHAFEQRQAADMGLKNAVNLAVQNRIQEALDEATNAYQLFREAKAIKQCSDSQIMSTALTMEVKLAEIDDLIKSKRLKSALALIEDGEMILNSASQLKESIMEEWIKKTKIKYIHMEQLSKFVRIWIQLPDLQQQIKKKAAECEEKEEYSNKIEQLQKIYQTIVDPPPPDKKYHWELPIDLDEIKNALEYWQKVDPIKDPLDAKLVSALEDSSSVVDIEDPEESPPEEPEEFGEASEAYSEFEEKEKEEEKLEKSEAYSESFENNDESKKNDKLENSGAYSENFDDQPEKSSEMIDDNNDKLENSGAYSENFDDQEKSELIDNKESKESDAYSSDPFEVSAGEESDDKKIDDDGE